MKLIFCAVAAVFCLCTCGVFALNGFKNVKLLSPILHWQNGSRDSDRWGSRLPRLLLTVIRLQTVLHSVMWLHSALWLHSVMWSVRCFEKLVLFIQQILSCCFHCTGTCWLKCFTWELPAFQPSIHMCSALAVTILCWLLDKAQYVNWW